MFDFSAVRPIGKIASSFATAALCEGGNEGFGTAFAIDGA